MTILCMIGAAFNVTEKETHIKSCMHCCYDEKNGRYIEKMPALGIKKKQEDRENVSRKSGKLLKDERCWIYPSYQPRQHHRVIKSDSYTCFFSDDIYPSFHMHLHSLPTRQSLHPSHLPPVPRLSARWNQLSYQPLFPPWALDPAAFQYLPWIWNSWCRLHSWLQNCLLPFAMWIVGGCNRDPGGKGALI